jgi:2-polyprenyl-3-methyl-5-hydroxy-6-metoxy-1,4-benzoquinol methylase
VSAQPMEPVIPHRHAVEWTPDKIGAFWDFVSSIESQAQMYFTYGAGAGVAKHIASVIDLAGASVLDFGCGPGHLFPHLVKQAPDVRYFGLDFSEGSIEQLTKKWGGEKQFAGGAAIGDFPVKLDREFDVVVCCEVIEHLDDATLEHVCDAFFRLLKKGGRLYLATPNAEDLERNQVMCPDCHAVFHRWQHLRSWNARSLVAQMTKHGFTGHRTHELVYTGSWARTRLLTAARKALGKPLPNLCYVGTRP